MNTPKNFFDSGSFNQTIYSCLDNVNALCDKLINIDHINIIVETQDPPTLTLCHINTKTTQKDIWSQTIPSSVQAFRQEMYSQPIYYNQATYKQFFSSIIGTSSYNEISHCYHIPLYWTEQFQAAIQFLRIANERFSAEESENLIQLAKLIENIIASLFTIDTLNREKALLEQEHLQDHILVQITNTAIFTQDIDSMVKAIAKDIIEFFNIDYIGLILHANENKQHMVLHSTQCLPNKQLHYSQQDFSSQTFFINMMMNKTPSDVFSIDQLYAQHKDNKLLKSLLDTGLQTLYLIPLHFGTHPHGAILLAHSQSSLFNAENIKQFQQIADRTAIAVDNIQTYQHMSHLNYSLTNENLYLSEEIQLVDQFGEIVGLSSGIQRVLEQVEMVANSDSSVLLLGETGTGKELFAKAIHNRSYRRNKRMIKINCSAVPANLLESELFGHERGAFTGANTQRVGRFELAHGSSLLLDEIGDIPLELQPKLLRVLQERELERLGSNKTIPVDVRIIAATNCNLEKMIDEKAFRADLYYRLNVFPIIIPPLRERKTDIPLLAQFFTQKFATQMKRDIDSISSKTLTQLSEYHWPGNVRELANVIERAVILNKGNTLHLNLQSFPLNEKPTATEDSPKRYENKKPSTAELDNTDLTQKEKIIQILKETNGIIAGPRGAAIRLGLKRTTLLSRMQRLGISTKDVLQEE